MKAAVVRKVDWKQWEGDIAGGEFPLEQFLGSTGGSAVFRTRTLAGEAAIKLVPSSKPWSLVDEWNRAGALDHPHLLRILKTGTWRKGNVPLAYLVMEYADEQLGTVLEERALSGEEARETFLPVAETLAFLHGRGLAHGRVKARNILAVKDLLKLSSESVAPGDPAADIRALGAVMVHALTGQPANGDGPSLPAPFDEIARNSMGANGRAPCSAADVVSRLRKKSADPAADTTREIKKPGLTRYAIAFALLLVVVLTFGSWWRNRTVANQPQPAATVMPTTGNAGTPSTVTPAPVTPTTVTPKTDTPKMSFLRPHPRRRRRSKHRRQSGNLHRRPHLEVRRGRWWRGRFPRYPRRRDVPFTAWRKLWFASPWMSRARCAARKSNPEGRGISENCRSKRRANGASPRLAARGIGYCGSRSRPPKRKLSRNRTRRAEDRAGGGFTEYAGSRSAVLRNV